jgi:hypothetical protein
MKIKKLFLVFLIITFGLLANSSFAQQPIGSGILHVLGIGLTADPSQQTVPINTNTGVNIQVVLPDIGQGVEIPAMPQDFVVMAELTGPGITNPIIITAKPGELLMIPPLPQKGTYILDKIRIVSGNDVILYAEPSTAYIDTIEKLFLTQVTSRLHL